MGKFQRLTNGTIDCSSCGRTLMTTDVQCGFCYSLNILSNISDIEWRDLENIPEEEYDHKIEQILKSKEQEQRMNRLPKERLIEDISVVYFQNFFYSLLK